MLCARSTRRAAGARRPVGRRQVGGEAAGAAREARRYGADARSSASAAVGREATEGATEAA